MAGRSSTNDFELRKDPEHLPQQHQPNDDDDGSKLVLEQSASTIPPPTNMSVVEDIPPDGGYSWVCTAAMFTMNINTWGVNSAWGIFLARYLADSTFPRATQFEYAVIGGLSISQCLMSSPLVAISNRKLGTRYSLLIGTALVSIAWLSASFATRIWHLFLSIGVCFGVGMGFVYITAAAVLPQWFLRHRSLAVGLASSGAGLGGVAYNLLAGSLVDSIGTRWTYRVLASSTLVLNGISSLLMRDRNKMVKPNQQSFNYKELGRVEVNLVVVWGFVTELGYITLLYSLPHYASSVGLTSHQGSVVGAMLNLGLAIGRPLVGYYSDRIGRLNMAALMTALCGVWCLALWTSAKTYAHLSVFAVLAGTVCGTFWGTVTPVTTEVVGLKRLPSVFGMICVALVLPTTFAEAVALELVTASGYLTSQVLVGVMFLIGGASVWLLRSWKLTEIEMKHQASRDETLSSPASVGWKWLSPRKLLKAGKL